MNEIAQAMAQDDAYLDDEAMKDLTMEIRIMKMQKKLPATRKIKAKIGELMSEKERLIQSRTEFSEMDSKSEKEKVHCNSLKNLEEHVTRLKLSDSFEDKNAVWELVVEDGKTYQSSISSINRKLSNSKCDADRLEAISYQLKSLIKSEDFMEDQAIETLSEELENMTAAKKKNDSRLLTTETNFEKNVDDTTDSSSICSSVLGLTLAPIDLDDNEEICIV